MCGRYYIPEDDDDSGFKEILEYISRKYKDAPVLSDMKRGEIYPTFVVPVLTGKSPALMKWGFSRADGKGQVINARLETAAEKPMFKRAYQGQRCLIPAGHYYEWRKEADGKKVKYAIGRNGTQEVQLPELQGRLEPRGVPEPLYMAGIFQTDLASPVPLFVILTRPAAPDISFIHDRMPVILTREQQEKWLSAGISPQELMAAPVERLIYSDAV